MSSRHNWLDATPQKYSSNLSVDHCLTIGVLNLQYSFIQFVSYYLFFGSQYVPLGFLRCWFEYVNKRRQACAASSSRWIPEIEPLQPPSLDRFSHWKVEVIDLFSDDETNPTGDEGRQENWD
jgi:hypothetical protein